MKPHQFQSIWSWANRQDCEVVALHVILGAMQYADGVYAILYSQPVTEELHAPDFSGAYCVVSLHVDIKIDEGIEPVIDLGCGDRWWTTQQDAWKDFDNRVRMDLKEMV